MKISVNGNPRTVTEGTSLADLLRRLELAAERVVVERNRQIVPRDQFAAATLTEGDVLEIVQFVGGG